MLKVRLMGTRNDIKWFRKILQKSSKEEEQASLEQMVAELKERVERSNIEMQNAQQFVKIISYYAGVEELSVSLLTELVEKITVGEAKIVGGEKVQVVKIYYKFIGNIA